ncbi:MAG: iron ABC transporter substrate-binding protein [Tissierellia bacterium]|nr:iron ABC transporter substrate-binding protein [Tissierellia bacterium]
MKKVWTIILLVTLTLFVSACSGRQDENQGGNLDGEIITSSEDQVITIIDTLGREVEIPENSERFINVGVGCLRLYTYVGPLDKLVGVERNETEDQRGVPYSILNREYFQTLPIVGQGGPRNAADPEAIVSVSPDVIFHTDATDVAAADELQEKTGIPVVALSYGDVDVFNEDVYYSLNLIGEITGEEERASEVVGYLKGYYDDLTERASKIAEEDRPSVYVGALGNKGRQGIESTRGDYMMTNVLNAINVVDKTGKKGSFFIDKEQLLVWDPDYIFIDTDGYDLVQEDYDKSPELYDSLTAVKEGRLHAQLPYVLLRTNLDTAIADVYNMGKVLYPEEFSDIDPAEKADEIYVELLGQTFYKQMANDYKPFGAISLDN